MSDDHQLVCSALRDGDADLLESLSSIDGSEELSVALARAAESVVFHRMGYHEAAARAVALGVSCDIWVAARAGLLDQVRTLLDAEPTLLDSEDRAGRTALQRSALVYGYCKPCEAVADFLLERGARIDGFTASTFGMLAVVRQAVADDPDLVKARCQGSTLLNWAVRARRSPENAAEICRLLIQAGADIEDRDEDESGMRPLHHAAEWGGKDALDVVGVLLDAGADLQAKDDQGWTALDYARDRRRDEMVTFLEGL